MKLSPFIINGSIFLLSMITISCYKNTDSELPTLNDGKPWVTDKSTRLGLQKMDEQFHPANSFESIEEYNQQADQIVSIINEIQISCTMSGQGHEELHKYINLLLEEVKIMKGNDINLAKKAKSELIEKIAKFSLYFE
ncbi:hypothetical protein EHQ68_13010 [Leptospira congkakensis]|uniref:Lipoprotein n=1 Tax=Leptospira congkakensis TaxID=2484932 RepID=A0A4Z1A8N2_9LEPT|nr:hypothetical protein [Leptospira congkakensis]TGL86246.1 hypothetical protein EHQ68_13010 [Leptospira congkakensis]TGL94210.1 hypothetical protein EHQ69_07020 [Leptospira congkakensis]TGL94381.1 hypothetical protein EHQ70_13770 [Leptospira congkakensis]